MKTAQHVLMVGDYEVVIELTEQYEPVVEERTTTTVFLIKDLKRPSRHPKAVLYVYRDGREPWVVEDPRHPYTMMKVEEEVDSSAEE